MGRVDEAMRRAAEAAALETVQGPAGREPLAPEARPTVRAVPGEPFPTELVDRPRARTFGAVPASEPAPPANDQLLPPVAERIDTRLQRKVVVDQGIDPSSREQYRRLAAGLHATQANTGLKVVMMVSAVAGEGKSLTSSNLALTFSESYRRNVLLIDADLRRPTLHKVFGLELGPGLSDGLLTGGDSRMRLHRVSSHLTILTAGRSTSDPMVALSSERTKRLIDEARDAFDWVLIDTPPIGLLSDASLLTQMADGAVIVVKAGSTPHDQVQRAIDIIGQDRVLGVVLNRADAPNATGYKYDGYYGAPSAETLGS
jgi:capsular exopolysaccharide synthesis family protein